MNTFLRTLGVAVFFFVTHETCSGCKRLVRTTSARCPKAGGQLLQKLTTTKFNIGPESLPHQYIHLEASVLYFGLEWSKRQASPIKAGGI